VQQHSKQVGNLYGGPLPLQNQKLSQNPTYLVDDTTQSLGQKGLVKNTYGHVNQRKQAILPQSSPLYQEDTLNTDKVYKTVERPLKTIKSQKAVSQNQYEVKEAPAYEGNTEDLLYLTPDSSKTLSAIQNEDDTSAYETIKQVKLPETEGPYDGITYTVNDNYPLDDNTDKVVVQKDQLEKLKAEIQSLEDETAANKYPVEELPVEQTYPVEEIVEVPIEQSKYPPGQRLVCTVQ